MSRVHVYRAYDLLRLRGWRPAIIGTDHVYCDEDDGRGWWLHPNEQARKAGPPVPAYTVDEAIRIQLLNDRVAPADKVSPGGILVREGWEVDQSDTRGGEDDVDAPSPYLMHVHRVRGPAVARLRVISSVAAALRRQHRLGWRPAEPDVPATLQGVWDWTQSLVAVWCAYCECWHRHRLERTGDHVRMASPLGRSFAMADVAVGMKVGHSLSARGVVAPCLMPTGHSEFGYDIVVGRIIPNLAEHVAANTPV